MFDLLRNFYNKAEGIKGKRLVCTLVVSFAVFIVIGLLIGYFISPSLNEDEVNKNGLSTTSPESQNIQMEGKIIHINPEQYPMDNISYVLTSSSGKDVLLRSRDQKLSIVEGLNVRVVGKMGKLSDGRTEVLIVEEVIIKSVAD